VRPSFLALVLSLLPKSLLSSWVGRVVHHPLPSPLAQTSVRLFAHWYHLNLAEAELPLERYPTIGALFSRALKPGARPIGQGPVHPADALMTASGLLTTTRCDNAKGGQMSWRSSSTIPRSLGTSRTGAFSPIIYARRIILGSMRPSMAGRVPPACG
jgi:phosphatidylserine decarboxylase